MKLNELKCIENNISLEDYYELYNYVRDNMEHPEWLELIPIEETINILKNKGKIWLYYDKEIPVCSMFYIPSNNNSLKKHKVKYDEKETGSLGPIMVRKEYIGNNLMNQMMKAFEEYNINIGNKYIFTKAAKENIYSINNILKNAYILIDEYKNERGINQAFIKKI